MTTLFHVAIETPLGYMRPVSDGASLIRLDWDQSPAAPTIRMMFHVKHRRSSSPISTGR